MTSTCLAISFFNKLQLRIFLLYLPQEPLKEYNLNIYKKGIGQKHDYYWIKYKTNELLKNNTPKFI